MTNQANLAFDILEMLDYAILERTAPREYAPLGRIPAFYAELFPSTDGKHCVAPWAVSSMLEFFLDEAEEFFSRATGGMIKSGVWGEDGLTEDNTALQAFAVDMGDTQVMLIRLLKEDYTERLDVLRQARQRLLDNRQLANNLSVFIEKSRIDGLTRIFNRATFSELLIDEIKRSLLLECSLCLLILDIDNFKKINDNYGHLTGDRILQSMGGLLKNTLRRNDIIARYGGEEFVVLIPHTTLEEARQISEKLRANLAAMVVPESPTITVSIGCAFYSPKETPEEFFARADEALYDAKRTGKNKVCFC